MYDATKLKPICIQSNHLPISGKTDEDCLYLNIYLPREHKPLNITGHGYPVMVWIHGGGYRTGQPQNATNFIEFSKGKVVSVRCKRGSHVWVIVLADCMSYSSVRLCGLLLTIG